MTNKSFHHKARNNINNIKKKQISIDNEMNLLCYRLNMFNHEYLDNCTTCFNMNPQTKRIIANKEIIDAIYAIPKYLVNEPIITDNKKKDLVLINFKLISLSNKINDAKNAFKKDFIFDGSTPLLNLYQLTVVINTKDEFKYKIILHQNYYEKNKRNLVFLGRIELGETHLQNKKIPTIFHIHIPSKETVNFRKKDPSFIYHCEPDIFKGHNQTPLSTALDIVMKKFNIVNNLEEKLDFKKKKNCSFLKSKEGQDWFKKAKEEKPKFINNTKICNLLNKEVESHPISDFIYNTI